MTMLAKLKAWLIYLKLFPIKNASESRPGDPLLALVPQIWENQMIKELTEENPFMTLFRANENLRGVPERLREPIVNSEIRIAPESATPLPAEDALESKEPSQQDSTLAIQNGLFHYETRRYKELLTKDIHETRTWFFDPQAETPLNDKEEAAMRQMGPAQYLQWICRQYGRTVSPLPTTEWECVRSARIVVRSLKEYKGEKFIQ